MGGGCQTKNKGLFKGTALEIPKMYLREEVKNTEGTKRAETTIAIVICGLELVKTKKKRQALN